MAPKLLKIDGLDVMEDACAGFEMYFPPTPMTNSLHKAPNTARFVILDDANDTFYDVDYDAANNPGKLGNQISWSDLAVHKVSDPAIMLPNTQWDYLHAKKLAMGFLVSIESRENGILFGKKIASVFVKRIDVEGMNWAALRSLKGEVLPAEMRAGLLRRVWNRRPGANTSSIPYVSPSHVLDRQKRPWHRDGEWLNWELDHQFAGCQVIKPGQLWRLPIY